MKKHVFVVETWIRESMTCRWFEEGPINKSEFVFTD